MIRVGYLWPLLVALVFTGCASRADEVIFHGLNAVDQAQSINAISRDCFHEVNPVTRGLLGEKPSSGEFVAYGALLSLAFHAFNRLDYVQERPALRTTVNVLAIAAKGYAVARNHDIGMRVSGRNPGCEP